MARGSKGLEAGRRTFVLHLPSGAGRLRSALTGQERPAMSAHLGNIALMVVMSHGLRTLGRISGPRWAGLALGLPCSTAVALVGGGSDRGIDYAVLMSGTSLIGLAGAVALPLAYALSVLRGWRLHRAILLGIASYLVVALLVGRLLPGRGNASLGVALLAVVAASVVAGRMRGVDEFEGSGRRPLSATSTRVLRTLVPIGCLTASLGMGEVFGPEVAGLMSTFPGVTLTVLALTHLESGPTSAIRMARALPAGNLGMVAFLAAFRFACPSLGLAWGTCLGYVASLAILALVVGSDALRSWALKRLERSRLDCVGSAIADLISGLGSKRSAIADPTGNRGIPEGTAPSEVRESPRPSWPRAGRRFSPWLETFAS
jgi:hypothetical protein